MTVFTSPSTDPAYNFALEEDLLTEPDGEFLLLYINRPCVVTGCNQQPEAEANLEWCARENIPVVRRISGGGAVWHDEGNVNWAFITPADSEGLDRKPLVDVIAVMRRLGIEAVEGSRGDILAGGPDGPKISGTASCVKKGRRLFHGTLLFDADLERMSRALAGDPGKRGRKVASTPSRTANVKPLVGDFDTSLEFMTALADEFDRYYNPIDYLC